ncbi:MAG: glycosyltransferase family 2 protein [Candidatus Dormibacteria bacterium]
MPCDLTVLVPVYNEVHTVEAVLDALTRSLVGISHEVVIVDDNSNDGSRQLLTAWYESHRAEHPGYRLVLHPRNRGKGAGIRTALTLATGTYFIVQDADLEYAPSSIPALLAEAVRGDLDVVYGSRFLGSIRNMPRANFIANKIYNLMVRRLYGVPMTDMHTCYKLIRVDLLRSLNLQSEGFDYATELVSKLLRRGVVFRELPIEFSGRTVQQGKKIGALDGIDCLYKLVAYRFMPSSRLGLGSAAGAVSAIGSPVPRATPRTTLSIAEHAPEPSATVGAGDQTRSAGRPPG